ncbi:winged helix DNA-binding domain-containing protein [Rhizohabitans arisaemae]|uniref:winged helix DNA-binding domain-containing protein n=1 Tax=Rhizohabitans arisaemae TaxID=2720610 RepID=UPI0024B11307|nr:winged helix DNA-binding domain-containing protein [Rhizohabitans arisaemae]
MTDAPVLSLRTLNRTLLQRQYLLDRTTRPAIEVVEHLVALQGQEANWPYIGLWVRKAGFRREDLAGLLQDRSVVRSTMLRGTQHLAGGADYTWLRPTIQPVLSRLAGMGGRSAETGGLDPAAFDELGREFLSGRSLTRREFGERLAERHPGRDGRALAAAAEYLLPLTHLPATGAWGGWNNRKVTLTLADTWLGRPMAEPCAETLITRYLAAFGPASVKDVQTWSGLTRLRQVFDLMRPRLRVYRDERGKELFDLPDAPLADPDLPAPVRFLPAFDNVVLGHANRNRIIADSDRPRVMPGHSVVHPAVLVDGFVSGVWSVRNHTLRVGLFRPVRAQDRTAVLAEAHDLLTFIADDPASWDVVLT